MGAEALAAAAEPPVQARRVERHRARPARQPRQLPVGCRDDAVADQARLDALELAVHVGPPQADGVEHPLVLVAQEHRDGQQPLAQLPVVDAHLHRGGRQGWGDRG